MNELHNNIIRLNKEGKSNSEISKILSCTKSTVSYHLCATTRSSALERATKRRKDNPEKYKYSTWSAKSHLSNKVTQFHRLGHNNKTQLLRTFTTDELLVDLGDNPKCYLTGTQIDLSKPATYSLDHRTPVSKGGESTLDNLGLSTSDVNRAKSDKTPEEFFALCKQVLEYNGYTVQKNVIQP